MSRTTLPDGSLRFAPDRGHRSKRKVPAGQVALPLTVAAPVGLLGVRGTGLSAGLGIAAVTAVVTLVAVLVWRLTLPRQVSVTVSPTQVTFRRYGRTDTVQRGPQTSAAVRTVLMQMGLASPYLIASCEGGGFLLNLDMWAEDDLRQIASALAISSIVPPKTPTTVDQVRDEFPGAMSFHLAHPNWTAIIVLIVAVPVVAVAIWAFSAWADDEIESGAEQRGTNTAQAVELPIDYASAQDRLLAEAQQVFGAGTGWESEAPTIADCDDIDGWQRVVDVQSADGSSVVEGKDPRSALTELARKAGMSSDGLDAGGSFGLNAQDAETGAFLRVRGGSTDGSDLLISTGSACVAARPPGR